jgi:hypothetical protein
LKLLFTNAIKCNDLVPRLLSGEELHAGAGNSKPARKKLNTGLVCPAFDRRGGELQLPLFFHAPGQGISFSSRLDPDSNRHL